MNILLRFKIPVISYNCSLNLTLTFFVELILPLAKTCLQCFKVLSSLLRVCGTVQKGLLHPLRNRHCSTAQRQGILYEEVTSCLKLFQLPPTLAFLAGLSDGLKIFPIINNIN